MTSEGTPMRFVIVKLSVYRFLFDAYL